MTVVTHNRINKALPSHGGTHAVTISQLWARGSLCSWAWPGTHNHAVQPCLTLPSAGIAGLHCAWLWKNRKPWLNSQPAAREVSCQPSTGGVGRTTRHQSYTMISTERQANGIGTKDSHCPHRHHNAPTSCPTEEGKDIQGQPEISHGVNTFGKHSSKHNKLSLAPCLCLLWGHFLTWTAQFPDCTAFISTTVVKICTFWIPYGVDTGNRSVRCRFLSLFMTTATPGTWEWS